MNIPRPDWHFRLMALAFRIRAALQPPERALAEADLEPGMRVLDYGCGPGSYVPAAARLVGESGMVYALDAHPLAIRTVQEIISRKHLTNVRTILSDCDTGLSDDAVDVALLYDVLHDLRPPTKVLRELHRVLKPHGILSVSDHHLKNEQIMSSLTGEGLFRLLRKGRRTYAFSPLHVEKDS